MPSKNPRFSITLEQELYNKIEDYRFSRRLKSQNQAVIELLTEGLKKFEKNPPAPEAPRDRRTERFIEVYSSLSDERKAFLEAVIKALLQQG